MVILVVSQLYRICLNQNQSALEALAWAHQKFSKESPLLEFLYDVTKALTCQNLCRSRSTCTRHFNGQHQRYSRMYPTGVLQFIYLSFFFTNITGQDQGTFETFARACPIGILQFRLCVCVCVCVCLCVCVWERDTERKRENERTRQRERERKRERGRTKEKEGVCMSLLSLVARLFVSTCSLICCLSSLCLSSLCLSVSRVFRSCLPIWQLPICLFNILFLRLIHFSFVKIKGHSRLLLALTRNSQKSARPKNFYMR